MWEALAGVAREALPSEEDIAGYARAGARAGVRVVADRITGGAYSRCSAANRRKYRQIVNNADPRELEAWLARRPAPSGTPSAGRRYSSKDGSPWAPGTGQCEQYLLSQAEQRMRRERLTLARRRTAQMARVGRFASQLAPMPPRVQMLNPSLGGLIAQQQRMQARRLPTGGGLGALLLLGGAAYALSRRRRR